MGYLVSKLLDIANHDKVIFTRLVPFKSLDFFDGAYSKGRPESVLDTVLCKALIDLNASRLTEE